MEDEEYFEDYANLNESYFTIKRKTNFDKVFHIIYIKGRLWISSLFFFCGGTDQPKKWNSVTESMGKWTQFLILNSGAFIFSLNMLWEAEKDFSNLHKVEHTFGN